MKILLLNDRIPPEGKGGAESVVWRLARGLAAAGHDIHVVTTTAADSFEEVRDDIPTYHICAGYPERFRAWLSLWNPQTVGAFRKLLERLKPDVVNAHNIHHLLSYHTLKLARDAGCGVVFSAHDAMPFAYDKLKLPLAALGPEGAYRLPRWYNLRQNRFRYNPFRNIIIRHYLERHSHIRTVPSQALADAFTDKDMPPVEVAHNGIDLHEWRPVDEATVAELRRRLDLVDKRVILIAGRLTREKGVIQILRALDALRESVANAKLLVLSSRDIASQIPADFAHLRPYICLGGWLSGAELRAAYQLADLVTVPSIYLDPFPTVNLEAMALAKPVVATCFGGSPELVLDGATGFIVNPFDTVSFADRLGRLLRDDGLRREMGWRGKERIRRKFLLEQQVGRMVEIYERAQAAR
ncbi:MAG: glycosyltransferase family 4 protein [Chloroflexi bacterium]|nr:glycosyltransferase family 4 protein [Chloroflexota bacterium]